MQGIYTNVGNVTKNPGYTSAVDRANPDPLGIAPSRLVECPACAIGFYPDALCATTSMPCRIRCVELLLCAPKDSPPITSYDALRVHHLVVRLDPMSAYQRLCFCSAKHRNWLPCVCPILCAFVLRGATSACVVRARSCAMVLVWRYGYIIMVLASLFRVTSYHHL